MTTPPFFYQTEQQRKTYETLELIQPRSASTMTQSLRSAIQRSWLICDQILTELCRSCSEPYIHPARTHAGTVGWWVYDPHTRETLFFHSETELRIWLESYHVR